MEKILRCVERRGAEETHDARNSPRGAPRGQRQARPPSRGSACRPRYHRSEQSNPRCFRGRVSSEPLSAPSGQFTEPFVARASWSLHKRTGLLRRFPDFRPHACFRKTGRLSTCGFMSGEYGVFSHPQSNVVNQANCTERWPAIWSQHISSPRFLACSATPIAYTHCE